MSDEINFSEQYSYNVQVYQDDLGDLGEATLVFGAGHWPQLFFEDLRSYARLGSEKKYSRLQAETKEGEIFTLFGCLVIGFCLSVDYVVAGDVKEGFKAISIRYDDIIEWFMPFRKVKEKIDPDSTDPSHYRQISVEIKTDEQSFKLSSEPILRIKKSGEDHIVHEHIIFSFERSDGRFSEKDIREKSHELSTLISILIARPLDLVSVRVTCEDGKKYYVFFSSFKKKETDSSTRFWADHFINKPVLDNRWQNIFERYYKSKYRETLWVRLAGMQRYEGFWEYKTLGYVSLLDKYLNQLTEGQKRKPSKAEDIKDTKVHSALLGISPQLTNDQESAVFSVIEKFFLGGRKLFFRDRYDYAIGAMDRDVRSIINLSDDDFDRIKDIRDAIAHGDDPGLVKNDHGRVGVIVEKIALLLTYWAFMDLGLEKEDFLTCLYSHNPLHLRACIDRVQLARVTKSAEFFNVSKEKFDQLSRIKGIKVQACFLRDKDGHIEYAEHHVLALNAWMQKRISGQIPVAEIFGQSIEKIKFCGQAYVECGTERLELTQAYFIESA